MKHCHICNCVMDNPDDPSSANCGGDCLRCMALSGDPQAETTIKIMALVEEITVERFNQLYIANPKSFRAVLTVAINRIKLIRPVLPSLFIEGKDL